MSALLRQYSLSQTVINTRPVERAAPLSRALQAAGLRVVEMPMLALQARSVTATDIGIMRAWLAGEYQALVMVSPTAASLGLAMWQKLKPQAIAEDNEGDGSIANTDTGLAALTLPAAPSHLIAVGAATAEVLWQAKLATTSYEVLQPTVANNEGMLAMPEIERLQAGDKLLVWRGLGGRRLLVDTLQARGVHIDSIAWYERTLPDTAVIDYQHWLQQFSERLVSAAPPKPIVIISSGSVFEHWSSVVNQQLCPSIIATNQPTHEAKPFSLSDFIYIVLGVRLAQMLEQQQLHYLQVEDLTPTTILTAIKSLPNSKD